jgi:hypothetical protein
MRIRFMRPDFANAGHPVANNVPTVSEKTMVRREIMA